MSRFIFLCLLLISGCAHLQLQPSSDLHYKPSSPIPALHTVDHAGDYALYYDGETTPQIPVHVEAGESIGFVTVPDGRVQAVAGEFRMNISTGATGACWKPMPRREGQ